VARGLASDTTEDSDEAVVDVEPVSATEELVALLLDSDLGSLLVAHYKGMHFADGLIDEAQGFLDGLFVDLDYQAAQELVKVYSRRCFSVSPISMANFTGGSLSFV
jgi:hypothetical protein